LHARGGHSRLSDLRVRGYTDRRKGGKNMSVRWTRSSQISQGHFPAALAWAKEAAGFVEKKFQLPHVDVWMDAFGKSGVIRWSIDFPDLGAVEKALGQTLADPEYHKLVEKAAKLFIDGSTHDTVSKKL
jgi:hypothetical protein